METVTAQPALKTAEADEIHSSGWGWLKPADVTDRGPVYDKRGKDDKLGVTCPGGGRWEAGLGETAPGKVGTEAGINRFLSQVQSCLRGPAAVAKAGLIVQTPET